MKEEIREATMEELLELIKAQTGDFIICVESEKEESLGNKRIFSS